LSFFGRERGSAIESKGARAMNNLIVIAAVVVGVLLVLGVITVTIQ
jgi:hypothetical protein